METDNKLFIYQLANDQINRIQKNYDQPGWTLWALLIALANVIWIGINELEKIRLNINIEESVLITFAIIFFYFGINIILKILSYRSPDVSQNRFEYPNLVIRGSIISIIFELFINIILIIVAQNFLKIDHSLITLIKIFLFFNILIEILFLLTTFLPFPTKSNIIFKTRYRVLVFILFSILPLFISFYLSKEIDLKSVTFYSTLKISLLVFLIYFIFNKLTNYVTINPILIELERIQHDLSFNIITPEVAIERIEIVIDGLKLKQLFQKDVSEILNQMHLLTISFEKMKINLPHINSRISELAGSSIEEKNQDPIIKGLLLNIKSGQKKAESIILEMKNIIQSIKKKLFSIHYFIKDTPEYDEFINNIDDILNKANTSVQDFYLELKQTEKKYLK